jgi:Fe-S oxidoreductase
MSEHLRFGPEYEFETGFEPTLNWDNENGFQGMVELCHGCGGCRSSQEGTGGVMCPTYRASQEEMTTTRGRANMLRQAMSGTLDRDAMTSDEFVHEVLDLCIGCKGCSKDCPSEVDMAKLKVEVEHQYLKEHGPSVRDRIFANIELLSKLGSATAPVSNLFPRLPGARLLMEKTVGIARERSLPAFHRETLVDWFDRRGGAQVPLESATRRALLFPDTYTNHSNPTAGRAAVRVLEAAGVHVAIPEGVTGSGRPPHSKGFLEKARAHAAQNVSALAPMVEEGWDVVVVEPSDAVMFQSDYLDLLRGDEVETVAINTFGIMEYLDCFQLDAELAVSPTDEQLTYHGHCHQKSTKKDHHAVGVLRRVGYGVDPLDSTCCGMAGSFGYEAEHYSMSQAVGRLLFAQIDRSDGESVVAPGNSCRSQIGDEYGEKPPHPIEQVAAILQPAA